MGLRHTVQCRLESSAKASGSCLGPRLFLLVSVLLCATRGPHYSAYGPTLNHTLLFFKLVG